MLDFDKIPQLNDLWCDLPYFEKKVTAMAHALGLSLTDYVIDHISVRCHHQETAERWHDGLLQCAELLSDNLINGRPIRLYDLKKPIQVAGQDVYIIELPFPKDKIYPQESWEHIEMVIDVAPELLEETARRLLPDTLPEGYSYKVSQPKGQQERLPNPTLAVTNGLITLKYHPFSLRNIVESEK
ncbi:MULTISPECIES: VOC family protein [Providencia]|jgi:predicted metalloenzyme YecM|uniref:VOC family protein n=1 Tax=Providencia TaxID=586 RepID=UPI0003E23541|nr:MULTISPECIES: VOC family protein [Providencia]ETS99172.1 YecM protein [Providencia alcalifaciens PAL-3]EUD00787.1 YecM protein [Providencia alcalifaciens PAL-1]MBG5882006.1 VOC family protein [Providencia alcalifaciens]MTC21722.1 VOC family protein [Providencia sp. wls1938]MTC42826.1 VOC family protein [Providencia sp. wls1921]